MTFKEICELTGATPIVDKAEAEVSYAYTGDLLSDIMGHCGDESVLITIQNHLNTIAVCTLAGIEVVLLCHGRQPPEDMKAAAEREGVAIAVTDKGQYEVSRLLAVLAPSVKV